MTQDIRKKDAAKKDAAKKAGVKIIVFQGERGAHSHMACLRHFREWEALPCPTFEEALERVAEGRAARAILPIENTIAGRVADLHHLLPETKLFVVGEHFLEIRHHLLARRGASLSDLRTAHSHAMALGQCRRAIRRLGLTPVAEADTAGAARAIGEGREPSRAAIASSLAAQIYDLQILKSDMEDVARNTTRFLLFAKERQDAPLDAPHVITSLLFRVRNVPAALYKALGGFATNGVNMTRLESCQIAGEFAAAQFFADIEGHASSPAARLALEELRFYSADVRVLGSYAADSFRRS